MNQTLNILRKDSVQLWPQTMSTLIMLVAFIALEPQGWHEKTIFSVFSGGGSSYASLLPALLIVNWGMLIIRLIQSERMVGLNQFWVTRPYEWRKLLAAKASFIGLYIYLPLILTQLTLLAMAHLPVAQNIPHLVFNLLLFTSTVVLPLACFSALTASFAQTLLALVGAAVFTVAASAFDTPRFKYLAPGSLQLAQAILVVIALSVVLVSQYSRRATLRSAGLFLLAPLLILLTQLTVPGTSFAARGYVPATAPPISLAFDSNPIRTFGRSVSSNPKAIVFLHIPLLATDIPSGTTFGRDGARITLSAANGYTWQSPWSIDPAILARDPAGVPFATFSEFTISRDAYERLGNGPLSMVVEAALTQLEDEPLLRKSLSANGFSVPPVAFCALNENLASIHCLSAWREPTYLSIDTARTVGPCGGGSATLEPARGLFGGPHSSTLTLHLSPIVMTELRLSAPPVSAATFRNPASFCPGTDVSFVHKAVRGRIQIHTPPASIHMKDYVGSVDPD